MRFWPVQPRVLLVNKFIPAKVHIQRRKWSPISIYAGRLCMLDILSAPLLEIATHTTSSDCIDMQIHASAKTGYSLMHFGWNFSGKRTSDRGRGGGEWSHRRGGDVTGHHTKFTSDKYTGQLTRRASCTQQRERVKKQRVNLIISLFICAAELSFLAPAGLRGLIAAAALHSS